MQRATAVHNRDIFVWSAILAAAVLIVIVLTRIDPNTPGNPLPACPLYSLTGFFCTGCGATRALHALLHGDLLRAISMNVLLVIALPVLPLMLLHEMNSIPSMRAGRIRWLLDARGWATLVLGFGVLRNLPWMPFAWLAPG